jgi:hypothetical protein
MINSGGGGIRFSVRKCDNAKMLERFLFPVYVKPLQTSRRLARLQMLNSPRLQAEMI